MWTPAGIVGAASRQGCRGNDVGGRQSGCSGRLWLAAVVVAGCNAAGPEFGGSARSSGLSPSTVERSIPTGRRTYAMPRQGTPETNLMPPSRKSIGFAPYGPMLPSDARGGRSQKGVVVKLER